MGHQIREEWKKAHPKNNSSSPDHSEQPSKDGEVNSIEQSLESKTEDPTRKATEEQNPDVPQDSPIIETVTEETTHSKKTEPSRRKPTPGIAIDLTKTVPQKRVSITPSEKPKPAITLIEEPEPDDDNYDRSNFNIPTSLQPRSSLPDVSSLKVPSPDDDGELTIKPRKHHSHDSSKHRSTQPQESAPMVIDPKVLSKRKHAIDELIGSEISYCAYLETQILLYKKELMPILTEDQIRLLFGNVETLVLLSKNFSKSFQEQRSRGYEYAEIGRCFSDPDLKINCEHFIRMFVPYIEHYPEASMEVDKLVRQNKQFTMKCKEIENEQSFQPLSSLIVMPVQRMPKYVLLMREILKGTPDWHNDHSLLTNAIEQMKSASQEADAKLNEAKRRTGLFSLQESVRGCNKSLISASRTMITNYSIPPVREAVVLSDMVLVTKEKTELLTRKKYKKMKMEIDLRQVVGVSLTPQGAKFDFDPTLNLESVTLPIREDQLSEAVQTFTELVDTLTKLKVRVGK